MYELNEKLTSGKPVIKQVNKDYFTRHAIKTHFVTEKDNYFDLISQYVKPQYNKGDILIICEKIISLCQKRIVYSDEIKVSKLAKFLSQFVNVTPAGKGIGNPEKMEVVLQRAGIIRVLIGALAAALTRPFGIKGLFYKIVKSESQEIDGFNDNAFDYYKDKGILSPKKPKQVCNEIKNKLNIDAVIADANDLNVEILGKPTNSKFSDSFLKQIIEDNPAGQHNEQTPFILVKKEKVKKNLKNATHQKVGK